MIRKPTIHDFYRPFQTYFRSRRMREFAHMFNLTDDLRILDVGGYPFNWSLIDEKPTVVLINLEDESWSEGRFVKLQGDGRRLDFEDRSFDIAYSNSVIEHVGSFQDQQAFANEIRRVADRYYVQTPNKWFVIEPHLVGPPLHLFPTSLRAAMARYASLWGWMERPSLKQADTFLSSIRLLDAASLQRLFPEAEILEERVLGLTKSLIAVRR